jgi:site-specific recombinase XerC
MRDPANLAALLQSFFTTRLMAQRKVSPHTIASYRDTFRLLLQFAQKRLHKGLRRTRHQRVCILNGVLVLKGQPGRYAAMACGGGEEHLGAPDSASFALPILTCAL